MTELRGMVQKRMVTSVPTMTLPKEPEDGLVPFPGTLRKGSRSQAVVHIQRVVGALADGIFERGTLAKVKQWQRVNGLVADGIVGRKTWAAMQIRRQEVVQPAFY